MSHPVPGPRPGPRPVPPASVLAGAPYRPDADAGVQASTTGEPPQTGHPAVDAALDGLAGLADEPLSAHPERLAQAHETLHAQLQNEPSDGSRG